MMPLPVGSIDAGLLHGVVDASGAGEPAAVKDTAGVSKKRRVTTMTDFDALWKVPPIRLTKECFIPVIFYSKFTMVKLHTCDIYALPLIDSQEAAQICS